MANRQSPRSAVLIAVILGIAGLALIASGAFLLLSGGGDDRVAVPTTMPLSTTSASGPGTTTPVAVSAPTTTTIAFVTLVDDTGALSLEAPAPDPASRSRIERAVVELITA